MHSVTGKLEPVVVVCDRDTRIIVPPARAWATTGCHNPLRWKGLPPATSLWQNRSSWPEDCRAGDADLIWREQRRREQRLHRAQRWPRCALRLPLRLPALPWMHSVARSLSSAWTGAQVSRRTFCRPPVKWRRRAIKQSMWRLPPGCVRRASQLLRLATSRWR